jgi:hypothetical protein
VTILRDDCSPGSVSLSIDVDSVSSNVAFGHHEFSFDPVDGLGCFFDKFEFVSGFGDAYSHDISARSLAIDDPWFSSVERSC